MKTKIDFLTKLNKLHNNESLSLGLYVEGLNLRAVWLEKKQEQVRILGAESIVLPHSLESDLAEAKPSKQKSTSTSKINAEDIQAELEKIDTIDPDLETVEKPTDTMDEDLTDITSDIKIEYLPDRKTEGETYNGFSIIRDILYRYPNRKLKIAVSIPEPQLYYTHFETNWGLSGKRLNRRIVKELMKQKPGSEVIKPEMMHNLNLNDESFIT
ncbi:hypothetical protein GF337_09240, partial [candidate division KSB1 bacterium]|nr:hypothetical protein [candidate division KSB1 bacterium]